MKNEELCLSLTCLTYNTYSPSFMSPSALGLLIGGVVPAVLFGLVNVVVRFGAQDGISAGKYMMFTGFGVMIAGFFFSFLQTSSVSMMPKTMLLAVLYGFLWSIASGCIVYALNIYHPPMSKLVPIFNMNTLIAVILTLIIFSEWQHVHLLKLIIGVIFVFLGGTFVGLA